MRFLLLILLFPLLLQAQTNAHINAESGRKVYINAPGQPATVTIRLPEYYPYQIGDVDLEDKHFSFAYPGIDLYGFVQRNTLAYVEFETEERQMTFKIIGNWANKIFQSYMPIYVDGVYNTFITLTTDNVEEQKTVVLPAGLKTVRITNGYNAGLSPFNESTVYADATVNFTGIITDTVFRIKRPVIPDVKWLAIGTSITTGASANIPSVTGYISRLRYDYGYNIENHSWGGRTDQTTTTLLADSLAAMVSLRMNGKTENNLLIDLGTNDYGIHNKTKAAFKADYERMLDAIIAIRPDITIYCVSLLNRTNYDTGNSVGATGDDFADAIEEACTTRPTTRFIYGKDFVTFPGNVPDGVHPNEAGHVQEAAATHAAIIAF